MGSSNRRTAHPWPRRSARSRSARMMRSDSLGTMFPKYELFPVTGNMVLPGNIKVNGPGDSRPPAHLDGRGSAVLPILAPPPRPQRRQVGEPGILRRARLPVVTVPEAAVLVGDVAPAPVRERHAGHDPEHLKRVDALVADGAEMSPIVAEVEHVDEPLAPLESTELGLSLIHISEPTRLGMISYAVFCLK